jgi:hypothetical protein
MDNHEDRSAFISQSLSRYRGGNGRAENAANARITRLSTAAHRWPALRARYLASHEQSGQLFSRWSGNANLSASIAVYRPQTDFSGGRRDGKFRVLLEVTRTVSGLDAPETID